MPRNQDLTFLYNKVIPPMLIHQEMMDKYAADHLRFQKIILESDSTLDQKASKFSLRTHFEEIKENYVLKESVEETNEKLDARLIAAE